ncbi:hypothetical protein ACFY3O_25820 [Streptomyces sp. NPDC001046]|uniref:hypothetical protein n=1 Tax=unclassified Streptomyces TaxID=2593676 RepID=UPI0036865095
MTLINSDVKLVHGKGSSGKRKYFVYVRCQVEGASADQKDEVPLEGVLTDTLTSSGSADEHLKYLLRSASEVLPAFQCQNNPHVPTTVPPRTE